MECELASRYTAEQIKIFLKELCILDMCMGKRKEELTNGRKLQWHTVHECKCAGHSSLFLVFSFSLLFFHSIAITQLRVYLRSFSFLSYSSSAYLNSYIAALVLHSFFAFWCTWITKLEQVDLEITLRLKTSSPEQKCYAALVIGIHSGYERQKCAFDSLLKINWYCINYILCINQNIF